MKSTWLGALVLSLLTSVGCELTKKEIRPPEPPEEFFAPPIEDPRYSKPLDYPRETLNQPLQRENGPVPGAGLPQRGQRPGIGLNGMRPAGVNGPTGPY